MSLYRPNWIKDWMVILKKEGLKSFIKQKGWKVFVAIIIFYTIRDGVLYVLIPYFVLTELNGCG